MITIPHYVACLPVKGNTDSGVKSHSDLALNEKYPRQHTGNRPALDPRWRSCLSELQSVSSVNIWYTWRGIITPWLSWWSIDHQYLGDPVYVLLVRGKSWKCRMTFDWQLTRWHFVSHSICLTSHSVSPIWDTSACSCKHTETVWLMLIHARALPWDRQTDREWCVRLRACYLTVYMSVCLLACLPACLPVYLYVCLSFCLY